MQWYKETEGIQGPSSRQGLNDTWSAEEVKVLVALHNTIGPRWQEICKHIPAVRSLHVEHGFTPSAQRKTEYAGPPSEFWKGFFESKLLPGNLCSLRCFKLIP